MPPPRRVDRRRIRRGGGGGDNEDNPDFAARAPEQESGFDDVGETKFGKRQEKLSKIGFNLGPGMDLENDLLESDLAMLDVSACRSSAARRGHLPPC